MDIFRTFLTIIVLAIISPITSNATAIQEPNIALAAEQSEIIVKVKVTSIEYVDTSDYLIDALTKQPMLLERWRANIQVISTIKGDIGQTTSINFFRSGIMKISQPKEGETILAFLSHVGGLLVGSDHRNWKFPASPDPILNKPGIDINMILGQEMIILLKQPNQDDHLLALEQLGLILRFQEAIPEVRKLLDNENQVIRFATARAIIDLADYESLPRACQILEEPIDDTNKDLTRLRATAAWSIDGLANSPKAIPHLAKLLESDASWLRERAAFLIEKHNDTGRPYLEAALRSSKRETRFTAARALADMSGDKIHQPKSGMSLDKENELVDYWLSQRPPLLSNGGFEDALATRPGIPPDGWMSSGRKNGIFIVDSSVSHSGASSIKLTTTGPGDEARIGTIIMGPLAQSMKISGYYRTEGFGNTANISISTFVYGPIADGSYIKEDINVPASEAQWSPFEKIIKLPLYDKAKAQIDIHLKQGPGSLWVDEITATPQ